MMTKLTKSNILSTFTVFSLTVPLASAFDKPNVVLIYGDDVGYGDIGVYGSKMIPTPNIDKLANGGLVFTDGHCTAATCSPSRFSLLTGVHAFRHKIRILPPNAPLTIPLDSLTLPKVFKKAGYHTAIIGKWHLGIGAKGTDVDWNSEVKPGPLEVGFDYSFLLPSTNDRVPCVFLEDYKVINLDPKDPLYVSKTKPKGFTGTVYPDGKKDRAAMTYYESSNGHNHSVINGIGRIGYQWGGKAALWDDEGISDVFVEQMRKFMKKKHEKPFFLYFSSQDIHVPRTPHPRFKGKTKLGYRGDAMVQFDWTTGEIMKSLEENGLNDNTIVIFSSDNGPVYDDGYKDGTVAHSADNDRGHDASGPFRGGKTQIYEGGTRVPFIISWPGKINPGTSPALVNQIDFLAAFASMLDVKLENNDARDSRNTLEAFMGKDQLGLPYMIEEARGLAIRRGQWKYIPAKQSSNKSKKASKKPKLAKAQLYNLESDPAESNNIVDQKPEVAKEMDALLKKLIEQGRIR